MVNADDLGGLDCRCIDYIAKNFGNGIFAARDYFGVEEDIKITIGTEEADIPHYLHGANMIGLPMSFLVKYSSGGFNLDRLKRHNMELSIPGMAPEFVNFRYWVTAAGIEETIHLLQGNGHERVNETLPDFKEYNHFSRVDRVLTAHEVEARRFTDIILPCLNIPPIWTRLDAFLKQRFPDRYGKPAQPLV